MCRSFGGKSAARSDTSVVNEEPSEVLVKLKKPTADGWLLLGPKTVSISLNVGLRALGAGSIGEKGVIKCFVTGLNDGPMLVNDLATSG
jgi:hypothetical protein